MPRRPRPLVMGVLNATPDSFSDGGRFGGPGVEAEGLVAQGLAMIAQGADLIDVGGESTRPGAAPVPAAEELRRVLPVVEALAAHTRVSIDTMKATVAAAAARAGATVLNDVTGLADPEMAAASSLFEITVVMHMRGEPRTMAQLTAYDDLLGEVCATLAAAAGRAQSAQVWVDPGVGFAKDTAQNLRLIDQLARVAALGHPVLVGLSRKRFVGAVLALPDPADRLFGSLGAAAAAWQRGAQIFRVHDVGPTRQLLDMLWAVDCADPTPRGRGSADPAQQSG
ncbi:MAG: hypothetical protein RL071_1871 [Pseudomonadota bacterium]